MTLLATATATASALDLRTIAPRERHALVFSRLDALQPGQSLQLINDHDPQPLRVQHDDLDFGPFEWTSLVAGPEVWRVRITRVGAASPQAASDSCCSGGACCG